MSVKVHQNLYDLDILINNQSLFTADGVSFVLADIYEDILNPRPHCNLEMYCPVDWINEHYLADGKTITFKIKSKFYNFDEAYDFRILNLSKIDINQTILHVILTGVIDFYDGYTHPNEYNFYGTSSEIFKKVANDFKLIPKVIDTKDSQLWCSNTQSIYEFFNELAEYGWRSNVSGMFWCLDRNKTLYYCDIDDLFNNSSDVYTFVQTTNPREKEYGYTAIEASSYCGRNNILNYGYDGEEANNSNFSLKEYKYIDTAANQVRATTEYLNINKDIPKGLNQDWFPFDVGNFHEHYYKAVTQNRMVLSTFSTYINIISQFFQPYHLTDIVNVKYMDSQNNKNVLKALTGKGIISAIHISIAGISSITSSIEVTMQGYNSIAQGETNAYR